MKITYNGQHELSFPAQKLTVNPGQTVDVPDAMAKSLLKRKDWTKAVERKSTKESDK